MIQCRFPCFYSPHNPGFVVRRYDLVTTKTIFLMFFTIPSACFLSSCLVLFVCRYRDSHKYFSIFFP